MAITPRHYLDFINQYANLFNEKRSELEEQQMHLNVGLRKIKETVDQVNTFCISLDMLAYVYYHFIPPFSPIARIIILSVLALIQFPDCFALSSRWRSFVET